MEALEFIYLFTYLYNLAGENWQNGQSDGELQKLEEDRKEKWAVNPATSR